MLNFNTGVNFTAGIPIIRTSPDHGTGYDIAGKGIANSQSIIESVRWAEKIIDNRRKIL
jgi:4-hydroxythreonine-4-phosphate dehydrogenase